MTTNGNNTLELRPSLVLEMDADMYGKHAQGKYPEQVGVWELYTPQQGDLYTPHEGKHRK